MLRDKVQREGTQTAAEGNQSETENSASQSRPVCATRTERTLGSGLRLRRHCEERSVEGGMKVQSATGRVARAESCACLRHDSKARLPTLRLSCAVLISAGTH